MWPTARLNHAFRVADKTVVTPLIYDENYIPFLLDYCKKNDISAIIPLFDVDLPVLAKNKKAFSQIGTTVVVSDFEIVDICNDKWKTFCYLTEKGFNVPATYISQHAALSDIRLGKISFPVMIKPRWGMGSIAVFEAENEEELRVFYAKAKRKIFDTYLKYESISDINQSVLIQEKLDGQEHGLDIINDLNGNYVTTVAKIKYAMRSGETDCAVTVDNPSLKDLGKRLSKETKHLGNLDVDVFVSNGECTVLEMNARFGGGYPFSHMAGVNLPYAIIEWLNGEKVNPDILHEKIGIKSQKDIQMVYLID